MVGSSNRFRILACHAGDTSSSLVPIAIHESLGVFWFMLTCCSCGKEFPLYAKINGKIRNLSHRKYCLECSPFGQHNTKKVGKEAKQYHCTRCGDTNPEHFTKGRYTECKKCRNSYNKRILRNKQSLAIEYLGGKCICCGYDTFECALDIHHLNPEKKDTNFSSHAYWSWERLKKELEDCVLLCSNCHRAVHMGLIDLSQYIHPNITQG